MNDGTLPKRIVGATVPGRCPPPEGGWFGTELSWPTEDLDEGSRHMVEVLLECDLPTGSALGHLLRRLFNGLNNLVPPKPIDTTHVPPGERSPDRPAATRSFVAH